MAHPAEQICPGGEEAFVGSMVRDVWLGIIVQAGGWPRSFSASDPPT